MYDDERDDLGDIWGAQEQEAYEEAQARNMQTIESFTINKTRGGGGGSNKTPAPPPAPFVPLYEWHRYCYSNYLDAKFRGYDEAAEEEENDNNNNNNENEFALTHYNNNSGADGAGSSSDESSSGSESSSLNKRRRTSETFQHNTPQKKSRYDDELKPWFRPPTHGECCMCSFGDEFHDSIEAPQMNDLMRIYYKCYGMCEDDVLAQALHLHFMEEIHPRFPNVPILTERIALRHIEDMHTLDVTNFIGGSIRKSKKITAQLENIIFREDGTYDSKALADCNRQVKHTAWLHERQPSKMMFHFDRSKEDTRAASNFLNIIAPMKKQSTQQKHQQHMAATRGLPAFSI
jgi:hypothetical protein